MKLFTAITWIKKKIITARQWLDDHEKILIPIYIAAIYLWIKYPEYIEKVGIAFLAFKVFDIGTDKSSNSMLKNMKADVAEIKETIHGINSRLSDKV